MLLSRRRSLVRVLAVFVSGLAMLLGGSVLAYFVMVGRFNVVVRGGRMVGGGLLMMFARGVLRCGRHCSRLLRFHGVMGRFRRSLSSWIQDDPVHQ